MLSPEQLENAYQIMRNPSMAMGERFRALFTLRNVPNKQSVDYIGDVLMSDKSALLKHECAYCLGQMQKDDAIDVLNKVLANVAEHPMVRHEAGEALGAIGTDKCLAILKVGYQRFAIIILTLFILGICERSLQRCSGDCAAGDQSNRIHQEWKRFKGLDLHLG